MAEAPGSTGSAVRCETPASHPRWCATEDELNAAVLECIPDEFREAVAAHPRWRWGIAEAWAAGWRNAACPEVDPLPAGIPAPGPWEARA